MKNITLIAAILVVSVLAGCKPPEPAAEPTQNYDDGIAAQKVKDYALAIRLYSHYIADNPEAIGALKHRSRCYSNIGDRPSSVADTERILRIDENNVDALEAMSGYSLFMLELENATEFSERLLAVDPGNDYATSVLRGVQDARRKAIREAKWRAEREAKKAAEEAKKDDDKKDDTPDGSKKDDTPDDGKKDGGKKDDAPDEKKDDTPDDGNGVDDKKDDSPDEVKKDDATDAGKKDDDAQDAKEEDAAEAGTPN